MSGLNDNMEMAGMAPAMPAQVRVNWGPIMNGLSVIVLVVWVWTLITTNTDLQKRLDTREATYQAQTEKLITVLTKIQQYMDEQKYQNTLQMIRNK